MLAIALPLVLGVLILGGIFGYGYMRIDSLSKQVEKLGAELVATNDLLLSKIDLLLQGFSSLEQKTVTLSDTLYIAEQAMEGTKKNVEAIQTRLGGFEQTVDKISGSVNVLEKLSKTDPELLRKYSKVYFLNEHYVPERLIEIESEYRYSDQRSEQIHSLVWPYLKALLDQAKAEDVPLYVKSAYRSFDEQESLKSAYTVTYGIGTANQFSADQGYSEHQLGTTADFITTGLGGDLLEFGKTQAFQWLKENAHRYGFVLSYPEGNGYYIFEPWHWRYVGVKLATILHEQNKYFYDLEQRDIDEYLVDLFE